MKLFKLFGIEFIRREGKLMLFFEPKTTNHWWVRFTKWVDRRMRVVSTETYTYSSITRTRFSKNIVEDSGFWAHETLLLWGRINIAYCF